MIRSADNRHLRRASRLTFKIAMYAFVATILIDAYAHLQDKMYSVAVNVATDAVDNHEWWEHQAEEIEESE